MKVVIDRRWTLEEAYAKAWEAYRGSGVESRGYRNSVLMAWGNVVGRSRALGDLNHLMRAYGSKKELAAAMGISASSVRMLERHFLSLPAPFEAGPAPLRISFERGSRVPIEEDLDHEFKEVDVRQADPVAAMAQQFVRNAVAFLNGKGGRILWGVTDEAMVAGVLLSVKQRDSLRKLLANHLHEIQPGVDSSAAQLHFHAVLEAGVPVKDLFVVECGVPQAPTRALHFAGDNQAYVRLQGVTQKLAGPAIQDWIERRIAESGDRV